MLVAFPTLMVGALNRTYSPVQRPPQRPDDNIGMKEGTYWVNAGCGLNCAIVNRHNDGCPAIVR